MCTTQVLTIPDGKGGTVTVEDTQDCRSSSCKDSAHYNPKD